MAEAQVQQHPIGIYFKVWGLLFVLSAASYSVDYFHVESYLRWTLILVFMVAKAGLIVAFFMHMRWERPAFIYAIMVPPVLVLVFVFLMTFEADNTLLARNIFFSTGQ